MVIRYYFKNRFDKIPKSKLMILVDRINVNNLDEVAILHTWERHLRSMSIPYCIDKHGDNLTLTKEQREKFPSVWE